MKAPRPIKNIFGCFYKRVAPGEMAPRWMATAYNDWQCDRRVMALWPLHYLIMFAWWLDYQWCKHRMRPSWIDLQIKAALKTGRTNNE